MDDIKLKPEVRQEWVDALRSGEYQQGEGRLNQDGKFCCLGILCEVAVRNGVIPEPVLANDGSYAYSGETHVLADEVISWAYVNVASPEERFRGQYSNPTAGDQALAEWNDVQEASFSMIASLIEQYL